MHGGILCIVCVLVVHSLSQVISVGNEEVRPFIKFATPKQIQEQNIRLGRKAHSTVSGFHPDDIKKFYGFSSSVTAGTGVTIAAVAAYNNENAESDLAVFSTEFGLPACTTANGCFKKVNSQGGNSFKASQTPWTSEICLDLQWIHAIAPSAKIVLVLADSAAIGDMMVAVNYARSISNYISLSWGTYELSQHSSLFDSVFLKSGLSVFASSGDEGALVTYPSASKNVISVGGTSLKVATSTIVYESGWSSSGGGCSLYSTAQTSQQKYSGGLCGTKRGTPDLSLLGDFQTGVAVYDSYGCTGNCWKVAGGTSLSAPLIAAHAAVKGITVTADLIYSNTTLAVRDIIMGTSKNDKYSTSFSCTAGYDLVTGVGSWYEAGSIVYPQLSSASMTSLCWTVIIVIIAIML